MRYSVSRMRKARCNMTPDLTFQQYASVFLLFKKGVLDTLGLAKLLEAFSVIAEWKYCKKVQDKLGDGVIP
jgi:hypothetical protein